MTSARMMCLFAAMGVSAACGSDGDKPSDAPYECTASAAECRSELAGDYEGTYSGETQGTWQSTVDSDGTLSGTAHNTVIDSDFSLVGAISETGRMVFGTSSDGTAFKGQVSSDFRVSGTWVLDGHTGTFEGRRGSAAATESQSTAETTKVDAGSSTDAGTPADGVTDPASCETCETTECSTQFGALTVAVALAYSDCVSACASIECMEQCGVSYPEAGALLECVQANCEAECLS